MVSSFFSKSKPINFMVVALYMATLYAIATFREEFVLDYKMVLLFFAGIVMYLISMFLMNIITQKNDLTQSNTYTILLFAFLTAMVPNALASPEMLFANLMILLSFKNILSLRNGKSGKAKIFNASLCIALASLAYFWSIGFLVILFLGILYFDPKNYRNWCIPVIGFFTIYTFATCFTLLFFDSFFYVSTYFDGVSFSFQKYGFKNHIFPVGTILICMLFFFSVYILKFKRKPAKSKPVLRLIIAQLLVAVLIIFWVPEKDTAELIFITTPLAIIGTTYMEMDQSDLVKEINIWVFLTLPLITLLL